MQGFGGVLQVDGYTGYNRVKDGRDNAPIELAYCWAHARRKLFELTVNNVAPIAEEGLKQIKTFYRIEGQIRGLSADERRTIRQEKTLPRMKAFEQWLTYSRAQVSAKSPTGLALKYLLSDVNIACQAAHRQILGRLKPVPDRWAYRDRQQHGRTLHAPHCAEPEKCALRWP